jgi:serine-type D-Ala-D-Ala endopeptidase (penicillin-binding protein 7)
MNILENRSRKTAYLALVLSLFVALTVPVTGFAAAAKNSATSPQKSAFKPSLNHKKLAAPKTSVGKTSKSVKRVPAKLALKSPTKKSIQAKSASSLTGTAAAKKSQDKSALVRQTVVQKNSFSNSKIATSNGSSVSVVRTDQTTRLSAGERLGLRGSEDALDLSSSVALVIDQDTNEVLFSKNDSAVLPIASLTKLMTGLVIADAHLSMDEPITITQDDVDTYKGSRSRLAVGSTLRRGELMHLALMSSENRAAHALGRTFPGGLQHFVSLMNSKARELGMNDTRYVEPTGLLSQNQSSARDLATLVSVAYERPILRDLSTSPSHQLELGHRTLQFNNSNRLIRNPEWDIGLQKTGYIAEAGRCLVMQAKVAGRKVIMVFLDSAGKLSRVQDAERVRRWVEGQTRQSVFVRPQG